MITNLKKAKKVETVLKIFGADAHIYDLDGTLYPYSDGQHHNINHSIASSAIRMGLPLELQDAMKLARESYTQFGHSTAIFASYGIDIEKLYFDYHKRKEVERIHLSRSFIRSIQNFRDIYFDPAMKPHKAAILTASTHDWADRAVERIGLSHIFNVENGNIIAADDTLDPITGKCTSKHIDQYPFDVVMDRINVSDSSTCVMFEDSVRNLEIPHQMGMTTVLIHHGKPLEQLPDYVDIQIPRIGDLSALYKKYALGYKPPLASAIERAVKANIDCIPRLRVAT